MSQKPRILCAGHSHMSAIHQAYREHYLDPDWNFELEFLRFQAADYQPNFEENEAGEVTLHKLIPRHFRHKLLVREATALLGFFQGNEANAIAMLRHRPLFDFHVPGVDEPVMKNAEIVPYHALRDMLTYRIEDKIVRFVTCAREIFDGPIYVAPPPPPIESEKHILSNPGGFRKMASKRGVSPAPIRRKMWRLYVDVLRERVEAANANLLPTPPGAFDADGYLKSDFWHTDPTHGNFTYGDLVIRHALDVMYDVTPERSAA